MQKQQNILLAIWTAPRETIRYALERLNFWYIAFISLFGAWGTTIISGLDAANLSGSSEYIIESIEDEVVKRDYVMPSWWSEILLSLLGGIATILVATAFMAVFYWLIGKLFKGTGSFKQMYKGAMLTFLPTTIILPVVIVWLFISPETFYGVSDPTSSFGYILFGLAMALIVFCFIYSMIVTIVMVSEVHQFSKWRAFFTILVPTLALIIMLVIIVIILIASIIAFI